MTSAKILELSEKPLEDLDLQELRTLEEFHRINYRKHEAMIQKLQGEIMVRHRRKHQEELLQLLPPDHYECPNCGTHNNVHTGRTCHKCGEDWSKIIQCKQRAFRV